MMVVPDGHHKIVHITKCKLLFTKLTQCYIIWRRLSIWWRDRGGQSLRAILRVGEGPRSGWRAVDHADHSRAILRAAPFRGSRGRATRDQHSGPHRATEPSRGCAIDHP